ncbi:hypothetical protein [Enterocloster clostridioformis]|uniref:hypothetical protein n=1 Tax=Enterocloster clostridioformis TaxID=1531 RepID=UPI00138ABFCB|nr:hypothetical protein [Enterocloster clostridioformis]
MGFKQYQNRTTENRIIKNRIIKNRIIKNRIIKNRTPGLSPLKTRRIPAPWKDSTP